MQIRLVLVTALASGACAALLGAAEQVVKQADVPKLVREAVSARYPKARATRFEKDDEAGKVSYEVLLEAEGARWEAVITPEGKIVEEERKIDLKEAPEAVRKALAASRYGSARVTGVEKISSPDHPEAPVFEIAVALEKEKHELVFRHDGKLEKDEKLAARKD